MEKLDLTYLESISGNDKEFIREMLMMFKDTTLKDLEKVRECYQKKDWMLLSSSAHKIMAPLQMLGQNELYQIVLDIERKGKEKRDLETVPGFLDNALVRVKKLYDQIDELLPTL